MLVPSKRLVRSTAVLALSFAAACAHSGPSSSTSPHGHGALRDPGPLAKAWRLPSRCVKADGSVLSETELYQALDAAKVVYIAERHTSPHDHAVQAQVIAALHSINPSMAIGLEMIKRPFQKWLDDYVAGNIDEATMLEGTEWRRRWGFKFALYRPIFEFARTHKIPLVALNIKDEITSKVAREGVEGLSSDDKALLPEIDFDQANYRASLKSVFDQHNMGSGSMTFDNFYTAQLLWDETMAQRVAEIMNAPDAPKTMVVLAGSGHIRYGFGIPQRAARRGAEPYQTVLPVLLDHLDVPLANLAADNIADYLWVMSADERKLPRLGPHPHPTSQPSSRPVTASR